MWRASLGTMKMVVVMVVFEYLLYVWNFMFSSSFYKKLGIISFQSCRWENKHRRVHQTVQVYTAHEWQSSDGNPNHFSFSVPLPLPVGYLLITTTIIHSWMHWLEDTYCHSSETRWATAVRHLGAVAFTGVSLLKRFSNTWPEILSNPKDSIISNSLSSILTWWPTDKKSSISICGTNKWNEQRNSKIRNKSFREHIYIWLTTIINFETNNMGLEIRPVLVWNTVL